MNRSIFYGTGSSGSSSWTPQPEYLTVKAAMSSEPSLADQKIQDKWVKDLLPVWGKAILLDNLACPDSQSSLINWKTPGTFNPSINGYPEFKPYSGWKGATKDHCVRSNFIPSTNGAGVLGQNNITIIYAVHDDIPEAIVDLSGVSATTKFIKLVSQTANLGFIRLNSSAELQIQSTVGKQYFSLGRNVSTGIDYYRNLVKATATLASTGLCDAELFLTGDINNNPATKKVSFALVFSYLTETEVQGVIEACDEYLNHYGNNIRSFQTNIYFNLVCEGHSFMVKDYVGLSERIEGLINAKKGFIPAVGGNVVADLVTRQATIDAALITETSIYKNVMALYIGANDVVNTAGQGTTAYNALKSYVQSRVIAGWKVFAFTMTPSTMGGRGATFESERIIYNNLIRSDLSTISNVYVVDVDLITESSNPANATYYSDTMHPTPVLMKLICELFVIKVNSVYDINYKSWTPSKLALTLISGGVKIDWKDNSGGTAQTEIWGASDNGDYSLLWTIAAGTVTKSETIPAVSARYYKIRGKNGAEFTPFTDEISIAMLGVEQIVHGDFTTDLGAWNLDAGWSISGGKANANTAGGGGVNQAFAAFVLNHVYRGKYEVSNYVSGGCRFVNAVTDAHEFDGATRTANGIYIENFTFLATGGTKNRVDIRTLAAGQMSIDNISVKEVLFP